MSFVIIMNCISIAISVISIALNMNILITSNKRTDVIFLEENKLNIPSVPRGTSFFPKDN